MSERASGLPSVVLTVAMCFLTAVLEGYDIQAFGIAAPKLVAALGLGPAQQGAAASIAMVGLVFGAIAGGKIADRVGRKPVLLVSAATFGICSIWTGLSANYDALLFARFVTGLGFGGAFPVLIAIATEISPPARRSATTGALFCGMPAGGALVSLFARLGGEAMDWRTIFLVGGAIPIVLLPLLWMFLPETRPPRDADAATRLLPALFDGGRAPATILLAMSSFLLLVVLYLMLNWLPTLVVAKGHSAGDGAAASFAFNISGVGGALLLGFVMDFTGARRTLLASYAGLLASMLLLGAAASIGAIVLSSALSGLFVDGLSFALYGLVPSFYPAHVRAAACGAIVGVARLGTIAGPLLAGELRQRGWSADHVVDAMLPIIFIGGIAVFMLTSSRVSAYRAVQPL
jgi:AAHS family 3-hydroxyphenylpropionic acid transporter